MKKVISYAIFAVISATLLTSCYSQKSCCSVMNNKNNNKTIDVTKKINTNTECNLVKK